MDFSSVESAIAGTRFAGRLRQFKSVGSTNALGLEAAQTGAPDGCVFVAEEQTAGRGRGAHGWFSRAGEGLYVSALVRPRMLLSEALWLSLATGLAAAGAIRELTGIGVDLRWPNDLLIEGRKCGGILVETAAGVETGGPRGATTGLRYAVIGVGINVNHERFSGELAEIATSLRRESDRYWEREDVLAALLVKLDEELTLLEAELSGAGEGKGVLERFGAASSWVRGKRVRVEEQGGYTGVTAGLDGSGFLLVESEDGVRRTVLSGGVRAAGRA